MFLSHINSIKEDELIPLAQYSNERLLTSRRGKYMMISNVCPHQKSIMLSSPSKNKIKCQFHNWEFDLEGNPMSSGATEYYCKNTDNLKTFPVYTWSDLLFSCEVDFLETIDLSKMMLVEKRIDSVRSSYKNIMNVFLDVDHIPIVHAGVYESVGFETVTHDKVNWSFYKNGSVQTVKENAVWAAVYPNTMIEWQQNAMFITVATENSTGESDVVVYKYRHLNMSDYEWDTNNRAWEMAWQQDVTQSENIKGSTTSSKLQSSKIHYEEWLR
jgi:phenylpropionate dioxygenase-like ring-hydroxylating dioxygenase large terminal subunit